MTTSSGAADTAPVLFLGREDSPVLAYLREVEPHIASLRPSEPLTVELLAAIQPRFVVSHGYRIILRAQILDRLPNRVINLHVSMLPWNRGADPVLWSVLEATPCGVTIHYMDAGVDTGDMIVQQEVRPEDQDTFASLYARCTGTLSALFREHWASISAGSCSRTSIPAGGTSHRVRHRAAVEHLLTQGWDTPIAPLQGILAKPTH